MKKNIFCVIGTRPELIKMAPVVHALKNESWANVVILNTGQHRELADQHYTAFNINPDIDLNIMKSGQNLAELTANLLLRLNKIVMDEKPHILIGQGDTTSVLAAALTSFYNRTPFAHIEAGLRTQQLYNPYPEEANRAIIARLASLHFAPTKLCKEHLLQENISEASIFITGNTVVDTLLSLKADETKLPFDIPTNKKIILVTAHRRENLGKPLQDICKSLLKIVNRNSDAHIIFPLHANPLILKMVNASLGQHPQISLCKPLFYPEFVFVMKKSYLILTDSGGIQEEASILGKPVLILRDHTERSEGVSRKVSRIVGTKPNDICAAAQELLNDTITYQRMAQPCKIYGDGSAAKKIVKIISEFLLNSSDTPPLRS